MSGSGSCRDQYDSVLDNQPNTTTTNDDPLLTAAETAWLEYAKGTYSNTDKRIFIEGFRRGVNWQQRRVKAQARYEDDYERLYGSRRNRY